MVFRFLRRLSLLCDSVQLMRHNLHTEGYGNIIPMIRSQSLISSFSLSPNYPALNEKKDFDLLKPEVKVYFGLMHKTGNTRSIESPIGTQSVIDACCNGVSKNITSSLCGIEPPLRVFSY